MPVYRISTDIRWAVVRLTALGAPTQLTATVADICERSVRYINQLFRTTGDVERPPGILPMGRPRIFGNEAVEYLLEQIGQEPDMYLDEMQADLATNLEVEGSINTISRTLKRSGVTRKKLDRRAMERCEFKRLDYRVMFEELCPDPSYAVFVDESAVDRRTTYRGYGYARLVSVPLGKRFGYEENALAHDGILTLQVIVGSVTAELFQDFIEQCLSHMQPYPGPKSVLIMDNCVIHKHQATLDMILERGMRYLFLPPYSPDFNPIELAFSAIKLRVRRSGDLARLAMTAVEDQDNETIATLFEHVYSTTAEQAHNWFTACHYY
ncbi:DDE superfamily endonuclease [Ceratobasidium sp. AG-Ba]|nr:DDE superfamily endonuclease [Ceratobasidium sp. AG-Ba]